MRLDKITDGGESIFIAFSRPELYTILDMMDKADKSYIIRMEDRKRFHELINIVAEVQDERRTNTIRNNTESVE